MRQTPQSHYFRNFRLPRARAKIITVQSQISTDSYQTSILRLCLSEGHNRSIAARIIQERSSPLWALQWKWRLAVDLVVVGSSSRYARLRHVARATTCARHVLGVAGDLRRLPLAHALLRARRTKECFSRVLRVLVTFVVGVFSYSMAAVKREHSTTWTEPVLRARSTWPTSHQTAPKNCKESATWIHVCDATVGLNNALAVLLIPRTLTLASLLPRTRRKANAIDLDQATTWFPLRLPASPWVLPVLRASSSVPPGADPLSGTCVASSFYAV